MDHRQYFQRKAYGLKGPETLFSHFSLEFLDLLNDLLN